MRHLYNLTAPIAADETIASAERPQINASVSIQLNGQKIDLQIQDDTNYAYFGFMAIPFLLALKGTVTELSGTVICPRTAGGTPMCYLSLGFCTLLLALKFFSIY